VVSGIVANELIPACAMAVTRSKEVGPLSPSSQQAGFVGCGCFFEKLTKATSACQACSGPAD